MPTEHIHTITTKNDHTVTSNSTQRGENILTVITIDGNFYSQKSQQALEGWSNTEVEAYCEAEGVAQDIENRTINFDDYKSTLKALLTPEEWTFATENVDEFHIIQRNGFNITKIVDDLKSCYSEWNKANRSTLEDARALEGNINDTINYAQEAPISGNYVEINDGVFTYYAPANNKSEAAAIVDHFSDTYDWNGEEPGDPVQHWIMDVRWMGPHP